MNTPVTTSPEATSADARSADEVPLREILVEDFVTHDRQWLEPGFWALVAHRVGSRLERLASPALRRPVGVAQKAMTTAIDWMWGINLPTSTRVGRRLRIWHHGAIVLNARSIGDDVHVRHDTTISAVRMADANKADSLPVIEDRVDIGSGACVLGNVRLGKGAFVGANSVVLQEVPPGAVVFGVPARTIPK